jgi:hypothetical protein
MRFLGWVFVGVAALMVGSLFLNWADYRRVDDHVEFHVYTKQIGSDVKEAFQWCEGKCRQVTW